MAAQLFNPSSEKHFTLSRSRVDNFLDCSRCFYLTNRVGIARPPSFPFNLNNAVDELLKNEFDIYREKQEPHPIMVENRINALPYEHPDIEEWREALRHGVKRFHEPTNLLLRGGLDDVWIDTKTNQLIVVDYKATSKKGEVSLDADWQIGYKRQVEFYQWLLRGNSFDVSDTAYFVYCNGISEKDEFNDNLEFKTKLIPYKGNDAWIEPTLMDLKATLLSESPPEASPNCSYCSYVRKTLTI
jgi:CRISPR/Cas system-associated exonuclease Cas4 (RecB family)|tara:strand:+ start:1183 stop:1911 length:729 start_codon:yes stop_codon:yes gene_type:complete